MKKVGLVFLGLVVLLVAAVLVAPRLIDWNGYKPEIARAVEEATGRRLVIGGDIEVSIFPGISLGLSDVSLSNAEGAARMFTLESVRGKLALFPLISSEVIVEELVIRAPVLHLEVDENGRPNWTFAGVTPAPAEAETRTPGDEGPPISGLTLGDVRLEDGLVTFRDARTGQKVVAKEIAVKAALKELSAPSPWTAA